MGRTMSRRRGKAKKARNPALWKGALVSGARLLLLFLLSFPVVTRGRSDVARLVDRPHLEGVLALLDLDRVRRCAGCERRSVEAALEARDRPCVRAGET